jgi:hypothetical protein
MVNIDTISISKLHEFKILYKLEEVIMILISPVINISVTLQSNEPSPLKICSH